MGAYAGKLNGETTSSPASGRTIRPRVTNLSVNPVVVGKVGAALVARTKTSSDPFKASMLSMLREKYHAWLESQVEHKHCYACGISIRPYHDEHHQCSECYVKEIAKPNRDKKGRFKAKERFRKVVA